MKAAQRIMAVRVTRAYRTVSYEAAMVMHVDAVDYADGERAVGFT